MDQAQHEELVLLPSRSAINWNWGWTPGPTVAEGASLFLWTQAGSPGVGTIPGHAQACSSLHLQAPTSSEALLPRAGILLWGLLPCICCHTQLALYFSCFTVCLNSMFKSSVKITPSPIWGNKRMLQQRGAVWGTARWLPSFSGRACCPLFTRASKTWQTP